MGLDPLGKDWLDLSVALRVEPMERVEIKIFLRPRHEPRKRRLAILGERKLLHEADLAGPATRTPKGDKDRHHRPGYASPAAEARDGRGAGRERAESKHKNPFGVDGSLCGRQSTETLSRNTGDGGRRYNFPRRSNPRFSNALSSNDSSGITATPSAELQPGEPPSSAAERRSAGLSPTGRGWSAGWRA